MSGSVTVTRNDLPSLARMLRDLGGNQMPFALLAAMTRAGQAARTDLQAAMRTSFDRPTRWTLNSLFLEPATKTKPQAAVFFKTWGLGGVPAGRLLAPQILGGMRALKSHEKLLAMRPGYIVVPGKWADIDAYGNVAMGMMRAIMAQLDLRRTVSSPGRAQTRRRGARRRENYFIVPVGRTKATHPKTSHLPPGIYRVAATGVAPLLVLAFVRQRRNSYKVRYDFPRLGAASVERHLPGLLQRALTEFPPRRR